MCVSQQQKLLEAKAQAIVQHWSTTSGGSVQSRTPGSNIPPEMRHLDGIGFKVLDVRQQIVCRGRIREEGQRVRWFVFTMTGSDEVFNLRQSEMCAKLSLPVSYPLNQNIIIDGCQLSLGQLSSRIGELLPPVIRTHPKSRTGIGAWNSTAAAAGAETGQARMSFLNVTPCAAAPPTVVNLTSALHHLPSHPPPHLLVTSIPHSMPVVHDQSNSSNEASSSDASSDQDKQEFSDGDADAFEAESLGQGHGHHSNYGDVTVGGGLVGSAHSGSTAASLESTQVSYHK